ncbi:hypothetical protein Taro_026847 [Colocasia esculenta]|uniref:Lipocalin/cytosolic fatty-acid binding domain-containing protein n=1 Tax=Colocasia esculenta TaxID=4460 RepID=A0A843VE09_COLES|nr:hypothetical protein [Colocasia esculenta]
MAANASTFACKFPAAEPPATEEDERQARQKQQPGQPTTFLDSSRSSLPPPSAAVHPCSNAGLLPGHVIPAPPQPFSSYRPRCQIKGEGNLQNAQPGPKLSPFFPSGLPGEEEAEAAMAAKEMEVVRGLDLQRYMGRWYEIASFPSRFQPKDGVDTRANYAVNPDGTVRVLNETWSSGKRGCIEGTARRADPDSDEAKLKVKFYVPPFLPIIPVVGDYWVLYIDPDYQYALIGQPSRRYLWILCRQNHMDEEVYNQLVEKAKEVGYDVSKLHKTPHSPTPPEAEQAPNDKGIWWIKSLFGK